jgi:hypothetical protein
MYNHAKNVFHKYNKATVIRSFFKSQKYDKII